MKKYQSYINGKWLDSISGKTITVDNPATEEVIGEVSCANNSDVDLAVEAAKTSFLKRTFFFQAFAIISELMLSGSPAIIPTRFFIFRFFLRKNCI